MADMLLGGIVINEILVDPNGSINFDTDGNGTAAATDEYIELYNASAGPIDISGLELWDAGIGHWFTFPPGTILEAGAHALVMTGVQSGGSLPTGDPNDLFFDAGRASAFINNGGDNVTVYDPTNDEFIQATYNGDALDDPTTSYSGFSSTATRVGSGEDFGYDVDGLSLQRQGDGNSTFVTDGPTPGTTNICFANGTMILTPFGERPVEDIQPGDLVVTADHGVQPVLWTFTKTWTGRQIAKSPNLAAVKLRKGALGNGLPERDLRLSQHHCVMVQGDIAERMFGVSEVLAPASAFLALDGVSLDAPAEGLSYYHIMLGQHEVLFANGAPTESLYLGKQATASIPAEALRDLQDVLGRSLDDLTREGRGPVRAREFVKGKRARRLIDRHARNNRPLVSRAITALQKVCPACEGHRLMAA